MARAKSTKQAVEQLRRICLALPEAEEKSFGGHTAPAFRVRDKLFVMTSEDGTTMKRFHLCSRSCSIVRARMHGGR